jgi:hypothetical protein
MIVCTPQLWCIATPLAKICLGASGKQLATSQATLGAAALGTIHPRKAND